MSTLLDGLVSYWKIDEASGTTAFDSVGSNDGIASHTGILGISGKINNGGTFNGSTNYIRTQTDNIYQKMTVGMWFKTTSTARQTVYGSEFIQILRLALNYQPGVGGSSPGSIGVRIGNNSSSALRQFRANVGASIYDGNYHLVIFELDGISSTGGNIIFDNVLQNKINVTNNTYTNGNTTYNHNIGAFNQSGSNIEFTNGVLDEVFVYDRILSTAEKTELYNSGDGLQYPFTSGKPSGFLMRNF